VCLANTLREDGLSPLRAGGESWPSLEAFARGGARFERALAPGCASAAIPSAMTSATSRRASLPERMRAAGYRVIGGTLDASASTDWISRTLRGDRRQPVFVHVELTDASEPFEPELGECTPATAIDLDRAFGRLVDAIRGEGRLDDTLVIFTSDPGEELWDHAEIDRAGGVGPGHVHFDHERRVPLVMRGPGVPAGVRVAEPASLADLEATIVELAELPAGAAHGEPGRSMAPRLRGERSVDDPEPRAGDAGVTPATVGTYVTHRRHFEAHFRQGAGNPSPRDVR
jgi:Sulfatase